MAAPQLHAKTLAVEIHDLFAARAHFFRVMVVVVLRFDVHTDFAYVTVEEIFTATCLACATFVTVEYGLGCVVVE